MPDLKYPILWREGWAANPEIRMKSSSGGFATAITLAFVNSGGIVYSCSFINGQFIFTSANSEDGVKKFIGSKYVKSNPKGVYKNILMNLEKNKKVLLLGLPCQIAAAKNYVGDHVKNYDSMLVLSHFKGHPMGGFGGALKNISIGIASSRGKQYIHGAGDMDKFWDADHDSFLESMADAASSIHNRFQGKAAYINVMKNMSVDCDCCAVAADPKIGDIGILASLDPVALDQACLDLVYQSDDPGKGDLIERIESLHGVHTVEAAAELGIGSRAYELVTFS